MAIRLKLPGPARHAAAEIYGFEFEDEHLKIVRLRLTQLKREVAQVARLEIKGLSETDLSALVRRTVLTWGLSPNAKTYLLVPLSAVITRSIEIPSRDPQEIREIMNLQASRHTPYTRAEIIIDMIHLGVVRDNYTKVLLIIVPKEVVSRQTLILERAGLRLDRVLFGPEGAAMAASKMLGADHSDQTIGLVHMDSSFTTFSIIQKGRVLFVRGIPLGSMALSDERDAYADRFTDELQKSLEGYSADEMGPAPKSLVLTGAAAQSQEFDDLFLETFHLPVKHQSYIGSVAMSAEAKSAAEQAKRVSYFQTIAPLLLHDRVRVDLTTDERKLKIALEKRARQMMWTGVMALVILSLIFSNLALNVYVKKAYFARLEARYKPVREEARDLEKAFAKIKAVKGYLAERGRSLEALTSLYETAPLDVRLSAIKYDEGGKMSIKGTSSVMASVFAFVANLEQSQRFTGVKTKYVTSRSEKGVDVADFEITCQLRGAAGGAA